MLIICSNCENTCIYYPAYIAARFGNLMYNVDCIICGFINELPKTECLNYMLECWQN